MSTSGGGILNAWLYTVMLVLSVQVGLGLARRNSGVSVVRWNAAMPVAGGLWLVVAVPSVLQVRYPRLLTALRRDPNLIRHHDQYWRILTSVVVQDGGGVGTILNLAVLAAIALLAVVVWEPVRAVAVFVVGQLLFGTLATYLSRDVGAGNSGATFALATSMVGLAMLSRPDRAILGRSIGVVATGIALIVIGDAHGIAVLGGIAIGALVTGLAPRG